MKEPSWSEWVSDDWVAVAAVSVTVNACVLLRGIVSLCVVVCRRRRTARRRDDISSSTSADCENADVRRRPTTPNNDHHDHVLVSA